MHVHTEANKGNDAIRKVADAVLTARKTFTHGFVEDPEDKTIGVFLLSNPEENGNTNAVFVYPGDHELERQANEEVRAFIRSDEWASYWTGLNAAVDNDPDSQGANEALQSEMPNVIGEYIKDLELIQYLISNRRWNEAGALMMEVTGSLSAKADALAGIVANGKKNELLESGGSPMMAMLQDLIMGNAAADRMREVKEEITEKYRARGMTNPLEEYAKRGDDAVRPGSEE